ncbi:DUF6314 family protein [Nocardioides nanhaiensis]|uniref:DUF6314 domain-containing protein n=1 Tax=Nocardioides nanhaiensis TaxID=1476871 RepID=A0ABP8W1V8_9ACTN
MNEPGPTPHRLLGDWHFERVVEDRRSGQRSEVRGTGSVARESATLLRWEESGTWSRAGGSSTVARTHLLAAATSGTGWEVLFDDERLFHPWAPGTEVVHLCGEDTYRGHYDLDGLPGRWVTRWHCTGPAKDYLLTTTWTRPAPH